MPSRHVRRLKTLPPGLTLLEMLVVLSLMALLASTILPSTAYVMGRARDRDVRERLVGSWKLCRATAMANQAPVLWELFQEKRGLVVRVKQADSGASPISPIVLDGCEVTHGPPTNPPGRWSVVIQPHGVSQTMLFQIERDHRTMTVTLPGVIDAD